MTTTTKQPPWLPQAIALYQGGLTIARVASELRVPSSAVRRGFDRANVKRRNANDPMYYKHPVCPPAWLPRAIELYAQGHSTHAIGREIGCAHVTVAAHLRNAGVEIRPNGAAQRAMHSIVPHTVTRRVAIPDARGPVCERCEVRIDAARVPHVNGHTLCAWCEQEARQSRPG